jgi:hypothetical protein
MLSWGKNMKMCGLVLFVFVSLLASAPGGWGQAQITTATVQGDVLDEKGGSVPDASVQATNLDTNYVRAETSNGDGHFVFLNLIPGRYTLTISKQGFATILQENVNLTVGQVVSIPVTMKVSAVSQQIVVTDLPAVEVTKTESSSTLDEAAVATTPVLGRKFEDLLTLTPGVSISQGPDGDEININGQRGIFNNISLDGGDYNNGFFGEQAGGQRASVDITLEAVKEFQIIASGANAEYGRTAGGVVNVITKSGTNQFHGSAFEYFRTEALTAAASDGTPLDGFRRHQFGGTIGGPIIKDKLFFFAATEGIMEDLNRKNLGAALGTPCGVSSPVFGPGGTITDAEISASGDCQRQTLLNFFQTNFADNEGRPIDHSVRNASVFGRIDYNLNSKNQIFGSYNFDRSNNANQTFDVPTYGTTANGIEGPSHIQTLNTNWFSTLSANKLNELHFTYSRETRPREAIDPTSVPDTAIGFSPNFRFGQPFFLEPNVDELTYRTDVRDNFSLIRGKHTFKFGGEWLHTRNSQIFRGFFNGRYIFDGVTGFLHYASPASLGPGFGPTAAECSDGTFTDISLVAGGNCPDGAAFAGGPLLLYLQHGPTTASETADQSGLANIANEDYSLFVQDTWKVSRNLTLNYGLRWDAQIFPDPTIAPATTAYGSNLSDPNFPSNGKLPNQKKEFQPRIGIAWDVRGNGKSAFRASWGIFNARQNMLTQTGAITTNGVQQQEIAAGTCLVLDTVTGACDLSNSAGGPPPTYPGTSPIPVLAPGTLPFQPGVTVFSRDYANPRIYSTNIGYEQQLIGDYVAYADFTLSKGVHLTRFINPNVGPVSVLPTNADTVSYTGAPPFSNLGAVTDTVSSAKSLYRGFSVGLRKRMSHRFLFDANYTYSVDKDDDSNERDPFTFRYADLHNLAAEYSDSDRDERHKFNFYTVANLPWGFEGNVRMQAHSAQPITDNVNGDGTGAPCSEQNSLTRFVGGVDCGRNHLRKDNGFFTFDFGIARPIRLGERFAIVPKLEMFNTFNNTNNVNPLSSPQLFDFNGFLRVGVGDPRQAQLSVKIQF